MKSFYILCIMLFGITTLGSPQNLDNLWKEAKSVNPSILEAQARWQSSEKALIYKGFWPNPLLKGSYLNLPTGDLSFGRTPMSGKQLMLVQKVPFWHAPIQSEVARYQMEAEKAAYEACTLGIKEKLTDVYYSLWYDKEEKKILYRNFNLFQKMVKIAGTRYESGKGLEQDVLRAQVEADLIKNRLLVNKQKTAADEAKMNAILGGQELSFKNNEIIMEFSVRHFNKEKLIAKALASNREIIGLRFQVKQTEKNSFWLHHHGSLFWICRAIIPGGMT